MLVEPVLEPVTQSCNWLEVADANPTELKRKHQVKDAYHAPPPRLSGVLTHRDLTLIKFYLWRGLMGERVLEIACSMTLYFLFRERWACAWKWLIDFRKEKENNVCAQAIIGEGQLNPIISSNIYVKILHTFPLRKKIFSWEKLTWNIHSGSCLGQYHSNTFSNPPRCSCHKAHFSGQRGKLCCHGATWWSIA